jgi:hypothetical protein
MDEIKKRIEEGRTTLGIEFGSTRVKAVLVDETFQPIASGNYRWENQLVDGYWTYSLEDHNRFAGKLSEPGVGSAEKIWRGSDENRCDWF